MSRCPVLIVCVLLICVNGTGAEDLTKTRKPSKDAEAALKRFVEECVAILPGKDGFPTTCTIGSDSGDKNHGQQRSVKLSNPFQISRYEMTQELYQVVAGRNPSRWKGPRNSVETVSYQDAVVFCQRLTVLLQERKLINDSEIVRLPTSIEWEYCCRAGTTTEFSFGNITDESTDIQTLNKHAWHTGNAAGNDPAVGVLEPNAWGLYDVHGYLWEFVSDDSDSKKAEQIIRGGSWRDHYSLLSSATYLTIPGHASSDAIGFRCVIAEKPAIKTPSGR